jgi:hypothetical protein
MPFQRKTMRFTMQVRSSAVPWLRVEVALPKKRIFHYESRRDPIISRPAFALRLARSFAIASCLILFSLVGGMAGYHYLEGLPWIDAFANAAMILSGMGPLAPLQTWGGKLFAGLYALYSGLVVIVAAGVLLAPVIHRMLHRFHAETDSKD